MLDHKLVEVKILMATKSKFKYIVGHNKTEIQPELFLEEEKVVKNINNRIIIPCERITQVQDGVKALHAQANKFDDYLNRIKNHRRNSPSTKMRQAKDDNYNRSIPKPLHLI